MKQTIDLLKTHFMGTAEQRWDVETNTYRTRVVDDVVHKVPEFDVQVTQLTKDQTAPIIDLHGTRIGTRFDMTAVINNHHPRNVHYWHVEDRFNVNPGVAVSDRAALTTEIGGYPFKRARMLAEEEYASVLQIGTEHSGSRSATGDSRLAALAHAAENALHMSIMKTAMEESLIADEVYRYVLGVGHHPAELLIGDSQAGITAPARIVYAEELAGAQTAGIDIKALCCYDKTSLLQAAMWLGKQSVRSLVTFGDALAHSEEERYILTISTNARLQLGAIAGKIPVLLEGELGKTMPLLRPDIAGQVLRYRGDGISPVAGMNNWDRFSDVNKKDVAGGHPDLARKRATETQAERIGRSLETHRINGSLNGLSAEELAYIYGPKSEIVKRTGLGDRSLRVA